MSKPIISLIIIILSLGFGLFYAKPKYELMQRHREDLAKLNEIFNNADNIKNLIGQTKSTLAGVEASEYARFLVFLPNTNDPIRLANDLQHIGLKNGVILSDLRVEESSAGAIQKSAGSVETNVVRNAINIFTPGVGKDSTLSPGPKADTANNGSSTDKKYVTTRASFTFSSTLQTFNLFINDLEKSLRLMNVEKLDLSPVKELGDTKKTKTVGPPVYEYSITVEAYSLK